MILNRAAGDVALLTGLLALAGIFLAAALRTTLDSLGQWRATWAPYGWSGPWPTMAARWLAERKPVNCDLCLSWWCCLAAAALCVALDVLPLTRVLLLQVPAASGLAFLLFALGRAGRAPASAPGSDSAL